MILISMLKILEYVLIFAIAGALGYKYWKTKDNALILFSIALVLAPFLRLFFDHWFVVFTDSVVSGRDVIFPFTLVSSGAITLQALIDGYHSLGNIIFRSLIIIGILMLYRKSSDKPDINEENA